MSTHNAPRARRRFGIARTARRAFRLSIRRTLLPVARRALLVAALVVLSCLALAAQGPGAPGGGGMPGRPGPGLGIPTGASGPAGLGGPGHMPPPSVSNRDNHPGAPSGAPMPGRMQAPAGRWWDDNHNAHSIGLTHDQQRRMDTIFQENRNALVTNLDNYRKAQARLDALSSADHPSEAAVLAEIQNVAQARADLAKASTHMQLQIRNEMTNEQLNKLEKLK